METFDRYMVTGGAGSIGSEIVIQLLKDGCYVMAVDISEYNLYELEQRVNEMDLPGTMLPFLCDVRHKFAIESLVETEAPEYVIHAAALKHVPMLEYAHNRIEAVRTNVIGTKNVADVSQMAASVRGMTLISTDKAVNPSSFMGITKKIAEIYLEILKSEPMSKKFNAVRFGNVLESSGSVIPFWRRCIAEGRDLPLTHPDVERYFMSIPEACGLVISATSLGSGTYHLDMGKPVKLRDLAKIMIAQSRNTEIDIQIVGLRPGEKLYEELVGPHETSTDTRIQGVKKVYQSVELPVARRFVPSLVHAAENRLTQQLDGCIKVLVPEYHDD